MCSLERELLERLQCHVGVTSKSYLLRRYAKCKTAIFWRTAPVRQRKLIAIRCCYRSRSGAQADFLDAAYYPTTDGDREGYNWSRLILTIAAVLGSDTNHSTPGTTQELIKTSLAKIDRDQL